MNLFFSPPLRNSFVWSSLALILLSAPAVHPIAAAVPAQPSVDPALALLNQAVAENPDRAAPLIARARYAFGKSGVSHELKRAALVVEWPLFYDVGVEKLKPALDDLDRAVRLEPLSVAPWIERGRMRLAYLTLASDRKAGGFVAEDTLKDFSRALEVDPANAEAWFEMGRTHLVLWTGSVKTVMMGILKPEGEKVAQRATALRQAAAAFSRAIYLQPNAAGEAHFQRALVLREARGGMDSHALLVDCTVAIEQALKATDAEWHSLHSSILDDGINAVALADLYLIRARILRSQGQIAAALADLDQALIQYDVALADHDVLRKVKDNHLNARFERGRLRVQRGDYDGALADFEPIILNDRSPAEAWEWRGLAHDGKGQLDLARADLEQAIKRDPKVRGHLAGSRYDAQNPNPARGLAPKPVTTDIRVVPPGTALEHKNAGNERRGKGDEDGALRELNLALQIDPNFADALNNRGSSYYSRGMVDLALADYQRAIEIDPKHRAAYLNRGVMWRELGEHGKERADLDRAVEFANNDNLRAGAYRARSVTRRVANDNAGALADALSAAQLTPTDAAVWIEVGHLQLNTGAVAEATASYRRSLELEPKSWEAHAYLAVVLALQDDATAGAELHAALQWSQAEQFKLINELLDRVMHNHPESGALKALKAQFEAEQGERETLKV